MNDTINISFILEDKARSVLAKQFGSLDQSTYPLPFAPRQRIGIPAKGDCFTWDAILGVTFTVTLRNFVVSRDGDVRVELYIDAVIPD